MPGFRSSKTRLLLCICTLLCLATGCPAAARGPDVGRLPVLTSDDPVAEAEAREADELAARGDHAAAESRYREFLRLRPNDRLAPRVALALGRLLLAQQRPKEAAAQFRVIAAHEDPAVAEQGRFYLGLTRELLGEHSQAIDILAPMVGRTIDPADTARLLSTLADAYENDVRVADAITTLQTLSEENAPESARKAARERIALLAARKASPSDIRKLYEELDRQTFAWRQVALRAVRDADVARDVERTRDLLEDLRDEDVPFDAELAALAMRAERPSDANPAAVGAILSLSGRARRVGELSLRGLMLAAGLPPQGPPAPDAPQLLFRDDAGRPEQAIEAVNELVSVHRVIAIIGPMDAQVAMAAGRRAQELGVPLIALSPAGELTEIGPMVFRYFPTPEDEAKALIALAKARGARRFAVLHPDNTYGQALLTAFQHAARDAGVQVTAAQRYTPGATSFGAEVGALAKLDFDALFIPDSAQTLALLAPALAAAGLWSGSEAQSGAGRRNITLLAPSIAFDPNLPRLAGRYLQGAVFAVPFDATSTEGDFAQRFQAQFSATPDAFAAFAHDAYKLVRSAVDAGATTRKALAERLPSTKASTLVAPADGFSAARAAQAPTQLLQLQGSAWDAL